MGTEGPLHDPVKGASPRRRRGRKSGGGHERADFRPRRYQKRIFRAILCSKKMSTHQTRRIRMNRDVFLASALCAAVALGLVTNGCSSTSNSGTGGVDGSTGVGGSLSGQGGATAGQGGTTGQGGASADAGQDAATVMMCNP